MCGDVVFVAPVVTGAGPSFSLGELQGHLAYDLNQSVNQPVSLRRSLASTSSSGYTHTHTHTLALTLINTLTDRQTQTFCEQAYNIDLCVMVLVFMVHNCVLL